jgi:hypothetical protein
VPAAAVIPAPIAYIKVVAVKKLVVGFQALVVIVGAFHFGCLLTATRHFFINILYRRGNLW